ncbi:MAG TPA: EamA family transporter [Actinomycetes bacterium]|nr:EamA family transporter [Actinomycetes bacterium]
MSRRGWALFLSMGVIWGVPYLLIKVAVEEISPSMLVLARTALAGLLLLPLAVARGHLRPLLPHWRPILAFAAIEICVPWLLLGVAEQRLSSSLTGLLIAAVPLVGALLAWLGGAGLVGVDDRPDLRRAAGLLVGLAGVGALVGFEVGAGDTSAVLALAVVAVCYAVGPMILTKWLSHLPGLGVITVSLLVTALVYLPIGLAQAPARWPSAEATWSVVGLALVCTALAFVVFFALIAEVGPTRSVVITYLNPAVALLLGVAVLGEAFTAATAVGFALILAGSVLATRATAPRPGREVEAQPVRAGSRQSIDSDCEVLTAPVAEP